MKRIIGLLLVVLAGALTGYVYTRMESKQPRIVAPPGPLFVGEERVFEVFAQDEGTGLREIRTWLELEDGREIALQTFSYPGDVFSGAEVDIERDVEVAIRPAELEIEDGSATLLIEARDFSWRRNVERVEIPVRIDTVPPGIGLATGLTYVRRGGTELAVYGVNEKTQRHGVEVGDSFFPGHPHPGDPARFVAFYALPPDALPDVTPRVVATDLAGNARNVPLSISIVERTFPEDTVQLSDGFLGRKVPELLPKHEGDLLEGYLSINRELRAQNAEKIKEVCARTSAERLWSGPFLQLPNSQVTARFAEARTYVYNGRVVDRQSHLGFDLASTSRSPALAANDGVVAFAGPLGIYGNTVILDHGIGLFSLYGHLSEVSVQKGQAVARGDGIGRTGDTGLAGGDHLHFAMLVDGVFVDPLEWLDERWIQDHVEAKLGPPAEAEEQL